MRARLVTFWLLLPLFGAAACSPLATIGLRTGGNVPRPKDCEIQFKYQSLNKPLDTSLYTLVGQVSVDFADAEWSEAMKSAVRPKACELGGEVAAIWAVGENVVSGAKGAAVMVYRTADRSGQPNPDIL